jgi:diaminopimelate decarboxylase
LTILDIGSICDVACLESSALRVEKHLSELFPLEAFVGLRVIAELGRFLVHDATALLTKVASKGNWSAEEACDLDNCCIQYVLNDGLYGSFGGVAAKVAPELVGAHCQRSTRRSRFVGPMQDAFDVVLMDVMMPELEVGESILWKQTGAHTSASKALHANDEGMQKAATWYYMEEGTPLS